MKGFTLIEIIVVITLAVILFVIVVSGFSGLRENSDISLAVDDSIAFLQEARAKTLSSESASVYGVHFETNKFVLFTGSVYNAADPTNKIRIVPSTLEISSINLNGAAVDVVFKRLTGETDAYGTATFRLTSDITKTRIIQVEPTGLAYIQ